MGETSGVLNITGSSWLVNVNSNSNQAHLQVRMVTTNTQSFVQLILLHTLRIGKFL